MSRLEGEKKALLVRDGSTEGTDDYEIKTYSDNIVLTSTTQKETGESGKSKPNSELTKNEKYTSLNDFLAKAEAAYDLGTDSNGNNGNDLPKAIRLNGENASSAPDYSVAIGKSSKANGEHNFAIGEGNFMKGHDNIGIGLCNYVENGFYNYMLGTDNIISEKSCNNTIIGKVNRLEGSDESKIIYEYLTKTAVKENIVYQTTGESGDQKFEITFVMPTNWEVGWYREGDWSITYFTKNGPEITIANDSSKIVSIHENGPGNDGRVYMTIVFIEAGAPSYLFSSVKEFKMTFTRRKAQYLQPLPTYKYINGYHNNIVQNKYFSAELSYPFDIPYEITETQSGYILGFLNKDQKEYLRNYIETTSSSLWTPYGETIPLRLKYDNSVDAVVIVNYKNIKSIFPPSGHLKGLDKWPFVNFPRPTNDNTTVLGQYNNPDSDDIFQIGCGTSESNRENALSINKDGIVKIGEKNYLESSGQITDDLSRNVDRPSVITSLELTKGMWIISANVTFNATSTPGDRDLVIAITTNSDYWGVEQINKHFSCSLSTTTIKCFNEHTTVYLEGASSVPPIVGTGQWQAKGTIIAARIG